MQNKIMPPLTAFVLACFAAYIGAWFFGKLEGNLELLLFIAVCVTGVYWLAEMLYFKKQRALGELPAEPLDSAAVHAAKVAALATTGAPLLPKTHQPWWLDWTAGLFPVILMVFLLRSFLYEPFKIPSGSMIPTLQIGDLILVNKFHFGMRLPVTHQKITEGSPVARGDVIVFRYPPTPSINYIKRVVGVPGDTVAYINKTLTINGKPISKSPLPDYYNDSRMMYAKRFEEQIGGKTHQLLNYDSQSAAWTSGTVQDRPFANNCEYGEMGVTCKVPEGYYFMMGDNRDDSMDSRYFGFVPDANIVGRAFFVWMNFGDLKRIGSFE